jgi:hypothetical protein
LYWYLFGGNFIPLVNRSQTCCEYAPIRKTVRIKVSVSTYVEVSFGTGIGGLARVLTGFEPGGGSNGAVCCRKEAQCGAPVGRG